jgi:MFS family permease
MMVECKWWLLSNTMLGVLMASIGATIVLIALLAIFRGINIDPFTIFQNMLWIMFGYSIVTATLLVTFGRISDMFRCSHVLACVMHGEKNEGNDWLAAVISL